MLFTENYKLGSFVAGDVLDPREDSRRFLVIDRQLLGLFQVFGNGIVAGWDVVDGGGLTAAISIGRGHVAFLSGESTDVSSVTLVPNAVNYVYAQAIETTRFDRQVRFFADVVLFNSGQQILLAAVTTNDSTITDIDTSGRNDISFIQQIKDLINQHRHRGGTENPSKIDLSREVMGQLPGFHIEDIDASKITTGILPRARIPMLEHSDLLNSGVLTHAQLDSFARNLSNSNVRLLGELSATNLLQLYLAFKHIWNDVDAYSTNMLAIIPGISPDSFTDFVNSTAVIDKDNHLIQGVPSLNGQLISTTFRTVGDFSGARLKSNIEIGTDNSGDFFELAKPFTELIIDSFDNVFQNDVEFPGWTVETLPSDDNTTFHSDSTTKVDGPFSAKFNVDQKVRVQATKLFSETQDWTTYNELEASIQTLSPAHGKIIFQILRLNNDELEEIDSFTLLQTNETTVGFRKVTHSITEVTRDKVDAIRIYTDTAIGWDLSQFIVNIDRVRLNNNLFFFQSGRIRFRIKTPQRAQWAAISWTGDANDGTIQARARTAPSFETFDQSSAATFASFSDVSGDDPLVSDNRCIEVEIALTANSDKTASPIIRSVSVAYITSSTSSGFSISSVEDFLRATRLENASVEEPGDVVIDGRIDVGDVVYGMHHSIQQASLASSNSVVSFGTPIVGIDGSTMPLSPFQAVKNNLKLRQSSLNGVAAVERLQDRTYLAADTLNDRIVIFDADGNVVQALASNNVRNQTDLYPISACYNRSTSTLYLAWSTNVSLASMDLNKMIISGTGLSMTLSNVNDTIVRLAGPGNEQQAANVSPIVLSSTHALALEAFFDDASVSDQRLFINIDPDAVKEGINSDNENFATLTGPRGMPIFVGNIQFIRGLYRPISISRTSTGTWLVCNAKPLLTDEQGADPLTGVPASDITSLIELNPDTGEIAFSDNSVDFSLLTLGGAVEINDRYIAVAGIVEGKGPPDVLKTESITATVGGGTILHTNTTVTKIADAAETSTTTSSTLTDFDVLADRRGVVKIIERKSGQVVFTQETSDGSYAADVQVDEDDNLVIIEKTFGDDASRGRVVKIDEDGNIFFQFGLKELASPNDVRVLSTGNLVVST